MRLINRIARLEGQAPLVSRDLGLSALPDDDLRLIARLPFRGDVVDVEALEEGDREHLREVLVKLERGAPE